MSQTWLVTVPGESSDILTFIQSRCSASALEPLVKSLLLKKANDHFCIVPYAQHAPYDPNVAIVVLKSNVIDTRQKSLKRAARRMGLHVDAATFARAIHLPASLNVEAKQVFLAKALNPVTHFILAPGGDPFEETPNKHFTLPPLSTLGKQALSTLSEALSLSLSLVEMEAIQSHFRQCKREPTRVELETIAQTWSEHCVHKSFHAHVRYSKGGPDERDFTSLLKHYLFASTRKLNRPFVHSAFVDNAGVIAFDEEYDIAMKVETHNRPSALDPFGGAHTGIGGVVRDILGVSATPFANSFAFCFAPNDAKKKEGITRGVGDYGNRMGIPTVLGEVVQDEAFAKNPLVFCGSFGLVKRGDHPRCPRAGDHIVVLGAKTGRDGLKGATFSSSSLNDTSEKRKESVVQIGHPMMQKELERVVVFARDHKLYNAITDCGAGGLSSAVCEMAEDLGALVHLDLVSLKKPNLLAWEIWLSESQERMVLAVPPSSLEALYEVAARFEVNCDAIGRFHDSKTVDLFFKQESVASLALDFLLEGTPTPTLFVDGSSASHQAATTPNVESPQTRLLALLGSKNTHNLSSYFSRYDHEIQGGTLLKPLAGPRALGRQPGVVMNPLREKRWQKPRAVGLSSSLRVQKGDPYQEAFSGVVEAVCKAVAVGTDPEHLALLDNFCWGLVAEPHIFGALVRSVEGCHDAAMLLKTPFVSGKDSLNNAFTPSKTGAKAESIPGTLLISACGIVPDPQGVPGGMVKRRGRRLVWARSKIDHLPAFLKCVHQCLSKFDLSGLNAGGPKGLLLLLAEMSIGGGMGLQLDVSPSIPLFDDAVGTFVFETGDEDFASLLKFFEAQDMDVNVLGRVGGETFSLLVDGQAVMNIPLKTLEEAYLSE